MEIARFMASVSTLRITPTKYIFAKNTSVHPFPVENCIRPIPRLILEISSDHQQVFTINVAITLTRVTRRYSVKKDGKKS